MAWTQPQQSTAVDTASSPRWSWWLSGDGRAEVVGESHYQDAIRTAVAGEVTLPGAAFGVEINARLIRESDNPYDENAVRVELPTGLCGYLSREDAEEYAPALDHLSQAGYYGLCTGQVFGGGLRFYGVWLDLASPEALVPVNQPLAGSHVVRPRPRRSISIPRRTCCSDALLPFAPQHPEGVTAAFGTLASCPIHRGKHYGERAIEVRIDDRRVGELTTAMSQKYSYILDWLDAGWAVSVELSISWHDSETLAAAVLLPSFP